MFNIKAYIFLLFISINCFGITPVEQRKKFNQMLVLVRQAIAKKQPKIGKLRLALATKQLKSIKDLRFKKAQLLMVSKLKIQLDTIDKLNKRTISQKVAFKKKTKSNLAEKPTFKSEPTEAEYKRLEASRVAEPNEKKFSTLHQAILNDSAEGVKQAIQSGADVNHGKDGQSPLLWAVLLKKSKAIEALLKSGANTNVVYAGNTLVQHAAHLNDLESTILLVKNGANYSGNISRTEGNIMHAAICRFQSPELVQELIKRGWNIHNNKEGFVGDNSSNEMLINVWFMAVACLKDDNCEKNSYSVY